MVKQENFGVEQFMDKYENDVEFNMGETCCDSLAIDDIIEMCKPEERAKIKQQLTNDIFSSKLVYGAIKGSETLKNLVAGIYNDRAGNQDINGGDVVITNGAIGANFLLFYTLINPGDKVIAIDPCYQQLTSVPNVFSEGNVIPFQLDYETGFMPDMSKFRHLVEVHNPKLVVINNPINPTGTVWNDGILKAIIDVCRRHDTYVLCDEVYSPLFHSVTPASVPKSIISFGYHRAISTGSMSKAFSLAGLRLGWIVTKDASLLQDVCSKRDYNTISVSMVDDKLSCFALTHYRKILHRNEQLCIRNIELVESFIEESKGLLEWVKPTAGSTAFVKFNAAINTHEMCTELASNYKVLILPGELFNNRKGFVRIGFGNSYHDLQGGLKRLKQYLKDMQYWI